MKNLPLSKLKKRSKNYFRQLGVVHKDRRKKSTIEYIVKRTFEALPKKLQKFIEDPDQLIKGLTNMINVGYDSIDPYKAMYEQAIHHRKMRYDTKEDLWKEFKSKEPALYAKYNSYMYRQGLSAKWYWWEHVEYSVDGSYIYSTCELPKRTNGVVQYEILEINYDYSGFDMEAYLY